ncbi:MAG: hypothetical protein LUD74_01140, partial [Tannerellaceae bacterium]|nr:hypothetical protein [Tannerellaceae bacterium]
MNNKYKSYKNINLLEEEDFIRDMLNRTPARDDYWDELVEYDLLSHKELEEARNFMEAIRKPGTILSAREKDELWHNIESENRKNRNSRAKRRHLFYLLSTAATITLLISVYLFYPVLPDNSEPDLLAIVQNMEPVLNEPTGIQVITSGQETFVVDQHSADILLDEKGQLKVNSDVLIKKNTDTPKDKINYNQLITPKGTRSR